MTVTWQQEEFNRALRGYLFTTDKDISEILNQRALNIVGRTFDMLPPRNVQTKRKQVSSYMRQRLVTRIRPVRNSRVVLSGNVRKQFAQRGRGGDQLERRHLIAQKLYKTDRSRLTRRAVAYAESAGGGPGLYGRRMRVVASAFSGRAARGVGFLKSHLIPVIRALNPAARYKFPYTKTTSVSRWPGSAGYGIANIATPGNPTVEIAINDPSRAIDARGAEMFHNAMSTAFLQEAAELTAHVQRKLQQEANRINARR